MEFPEDEPMDDFEWFSISEDIRDVDVWVTRDHQVLYWDELPLKQLNNIVRGILNGKPFFGQGHKLERAKQQLAIAMNAPTDNRKN